MSHPSHHVFLTTLFDSVFEIHEGDWSYMETMVIDGSSYMTEYNLMSKKESMYDTDFSNITDTFYTFSLRCLFALATSPVHLLDCAAPLQHSLDNPR